MWPPRSPGSSGDARSTLTGASLESATSIAYEVSATDFARITLIPSSSTIASIFFIATMPGSTAYR